MVSEITRSRHTTTCSPVSLMDMAEMIECGTAIKDRGFSGYYEYRALPDSGPAGNDEHTQYRNAVSTVNRGAGKGASIVGEYPRPGKNAGGNTSDIFEKCGRCRKSLHPHGA